MHKSLEFAFFLSPVRLSFSFPSFSEVIFPLSHGHSFNANISYDAGMRGKVCRFKYLALWMYSTSPV